MCFKWIEHLPSKEAVSGSNPDGLTLTLRIATRGFCFLTLLLLGLQRTYIISNSYTDKIDVSKLSKGVYIINISDGVSQTNKKFIKN